MRNVCDTQRKRWNKREKLQTIPQTELKRGGGGWWMVEGGIVGRRGSAADADYKMPIGQSS